MSGTNGLRIQLELAARHSGAFHVESSGVHPQRASGGGRSYWGQQSSPQTDSFPPIVPSPRPSEPDVQSFQPSYKVTNAFLDPQNKPSTSRICVRTLSGDLLLSVLWRPAEGSSKVRRGFSWVQGRNRYENTGPQNIHAGTEQELASLPSPFH